MEKLNKNNLYLRILEFWEAHPKWFTYSELKKNTTLQNWEDDVIRRYLYNAVLNNNESNKVLHETIFLKINISHNQPWQTVETTKLILPSEEEKMNESIRNSHFILKYDAYFNYIDYLELQKAIENSKEASSQARLAMYIAVWLWLIQIIVWIIQISITK